MLRKFVRRLGLRTVCNINENSASDPRVYFTASNAGAWLGAEQLSNVLLAHSVVVVRPLFVRPGHDVRVFQHFSVCIGKHFLLISQHYE